MVEVLPKFGYWDCRGLAGCCRALLVHLGVEFEDKMYKEGAGPEYDTEDWLQEKHTYGLEWPNIPYFITADLKVTNSYTILRMICRKYKPEYLGRNLKEQADAETLMIQLYDINVALTKPMYYDSFDWAEGVQKSRIFVTAMLAQKGERRFAVSDEPTYVEFFMYEYIAKIKYLEPDLYAEFPALEPYFQVLSSLENMDKYAALAGVIKFNMAKAKRNFTVLPASELSVD
jgi:glutathione S-transferase